MRIIRATADDLDRLAVLFDGYRSFYEQPSDVDGARAFLAERLAAGESVVFMAEDEEGRAMGFTQLYPLFSSVRMGRVWLLNDLYVDAAARRTGLGDALMQAAEEFAREQGALGMQLETAEDNHAGQALYERRGWTVERGFLHYGLAL